MSFITKLKSMLSSYNARLKAIADQQVRAADARAKKKIAEATTRTQKLQAKATADREKARIYRELSEAQTAARNAATALKKARYEAGDLTTSQKLQKIASGLQKGITDFQRGVSGFQKGFNKSFGTTPRRKTATKRRVARRKPIRRR